MEKTPSIWFNSIFRIRSEPHIFFLEYAVILWRYCDDIVSSYITKVGKNVLNTNETKRICVCSNSSGIWNAAHPTNSV